ncbi:nucleotidyl transferase AbiEii/AbiGii toxin family protein [candidate division WOR-3 bacterium]|nr:nucleotidyl transferase AbiEii/AbiGii toxin family protein [candidate division WOR-3 bacterium]
MEDIIRNLLSKERTAEEKINRLREFLQILILREIYERKYFQHLSFVGGTALRFLYGLRRFSEDLDFSVFSRPGYDFDKLATDLRRGMGYHGFDVDVKTDDLKTVQNIDLKFINLLVTYGLSRIKSQKLYIRMEIDTNPPRGWKTEVSAINRTFIFTVTHFDLNSLFALKVHACFYRKYTKGRDFYDLIWYLGKKILPNFPLLNSAVKQTEGKDPRITPANFRAFLAEKLTGTDFARARKDVERFLEDKSELKLFDRQTILSMLEP